MKKLLVTLALAGFAAMAHAQETPKARLDKSPRHLEFIKIKSGEREVNSFIAFPQVEKKATAVIVIHEIFGLTDWVRGVTDQLAEAGYIAIAPDFLSGTPGASGGDGARAAIGALAPRQITEDLEAAVKYAASLPACNGKVVVAGFCWGGKQAFRFAATNKEVKAALVFYGDAPSEADMKNISCPVYGFYGGNDARITAAVPKTEEAMKTAEKTYDQKTYAGAGHGFMRAGEAADASEANKKAREESWKRWKEILEKL
ncbi:MAG: dienelactone hydrolase family protein [Akkermansiaceae bacterium]|nr:dienelactone hydrolase family protein [Verrucomicrobiales bacterium]